MGLVEARYSAGGTVRFSPAPRVNSEDPTPTAFDAAATAAALLGTWCYESNEEPSGFGYLHFSADEGSLRSIQYALDSHRPERLYRMRLWCSLESPSLMRMRPKPEHEGWTCRYRLDSATTLHIASKVRMIPCRRIAAETAPEWFRDALAAGRSTCPTPPDHARPRTNS